MSTTGEIADLVRYDLAQRGVKIEPVDCLSLVEDVLEDFGDERPDWGVLLGRVDDAIDALPQVYGDGKPASRTEAIASIEAFLGDFATDYDVDAIFREAYDYHSGGLVCHTGDFDYRVIHRGPGYFLTAEGGVFETIVQNNERKCD